MYRIVIQPTAFKLLKEISDRRIRQKISDRIDKLRESPEIQGKPLLGELVVCQAKDCEFQGKRI